MATTISDRLYNLCRNKQSVSSVLANDETMSPGDAASKLYFSDNVFSFDDGRPPRHRVPVTEGELHRAYECGNFKGTKPSDLFLPSLVGSTGVIPLTIIGPLPDICRHMSNVIARAEQEVFLATNYWMDSDASRLITDALKELSRRAGERGKKAVVKIMYDRGNVKQLIDNHQLMTEEQYTGKNIRLPSKTEAPNLDMQVLNYHRPLLGTFHSKFMVVDRKVGVVSSNNIQDNDNVEMMAHLEGPIVDSLYDTLLISWHKSLEPSLPARQTPAVEGGLHTFDQKSSHSGFNANGSLHVPNMGLARSLEQVARDGERVNLPLHAGGDPHYDSDIAGEVTRMQSILTPRDGERPVDVITRHLNLATHQKNRKGTAPDSRISQEMTPYIPHSVHALLPIALVNRKPYGALNHGGAYMPQNEAWLSAVRNATEDIFIQTPDLNAAPLLAELLAAVRRGIKVTYYVCLGYNDAGELLPFQGGHNEMVANRLYEKLSDPADRARLHVHYYVAKDQIMPIHNKFKSRSCHIKLMIVDCHIGIMGNGNQDTQSWFHSQEVNILIDSPDICAAWRQGIERNQNTGMYGKASQEDGIWRDEHGKEAPGAIGKDPGRFSWAKGILGAVQRVRGAGGF